MPHTENRAAQLHGVNDTRSPHSKRVRFRLAECEHAIKQAIRSRRLARQLINEAEAIQVITHHEAELMRTRLEQV